MTLLAATDEFRRLADLLPQFRAARAADRSRAVRSSSSSS
jgi:hypothetical protein